MNPKINDIKKILFIDDDPSLLEIIPLILEDFKVYTHHSAVDLEMRIRELVPDLVILDVNLRGIDGSKACQKLKSNASLKHIPVILMTAGLFLSKDRECGAEALLEKPFDIEYLGKIIISLLT
ncbi:response regulator [Pedobacter nototheniae]|uniref:response regulator n=1 Tax=Pedobacter nototheniae TaxID=2488994 RepID=UPI0013F3CFE8|nr:response regulator [Pedobacter nototheniae]